MVIIIIFLKQILHILHSVHVFKSTQLLTSSAKNLPLSVNNLNLMFLIGKKHNITILFLQRKSSFNRVYVIL